MLENAHLKYAMLKTIAQYPEMYMYEHKCTVISTTMSEALDDVTPRYYKAFMSRCTGTSQYYTYVTKVIIQLYYS